MTNQDRLIPAAQAAAAVGMPRERLVRAIQGRAIRGEYRDGHWYIERAEVERLAAECHATAA